MLPPAEPRGTHPLSGYLRKLSQAVRANRILPGAGYLVKEGPTGTMLEVKTAGGTVSNLHPFQLYRVSSGQVAEEDRDKPCYAVRSGYIELRPRWKNWSGLGAGALFSAPPNFSYYADPYGGGNLATGDTEVFGDDVTHASPSGNLGQYGQYFALDTTPEELAGVDQGVYYSFWIEITDDTPNTAPDIQIKARRFNPHGGGMYPHAAFPDPVYVDGGIETEIIQIAILQYSLGDAGAVYVQNSGVGVTPGSEGAGYISQILRTNLINRYDPIGFRFQGEFVATQYRCWYPGDMVTFDGAVDVEGELPDSDPTSDKAGVWRCYRFCQNNGSVTDPTSTGLYFVYWANNNPPSATNPP